MEKKTLNIAAKILYIDFEGRSDSKSIKELLEKIKPRQLVSVPQQTYVWMFSGICE